MVKSIKKNGGNSRRKSAKSSKFGRSKPILNKNDKSRASYDSSQIRENSDVIDKSQTKSKLSDLQLKFSKKLDGARFRMINETLYTTTGSKAFNDFQQDPSLFDIYHKGFREQASQWPQNPLDNIIDWIKKHHSTSIIADLGCGDAKLANSVKNKVYSFDLVSTNDKVIACDIAHIPLPDESIDIVVFCLSLMGTNISDFIRESYRILKNNGILKIVEVRSRFEDNGTNNIKNFIKYLKTAGFDINPHNNTNLNVMFFEIECKKNKSRSSSIDIEFKVKACLYKKR